MLGAASLACAPAPRMGEAVDIAEENAIIIWDAAAKMQHFIRRASFETKAKDFGFLVPTPTVPTLAEAGDEAFGLLAYITRPPPPPRDLPTSKSEAPKLAAVAPAAAVKVLATAKVAGYDAAVLEANDSIALDRWLKENGYHSSPELVDWYKPYVEQKWKITAFKIAKDDADAGKVDSSAVRMSFAADRPFFPHREPKGSSAGGTPRLLKVYLLAESRFDGAIGKGTAWPGRAVWSKPLQDSDRSRVLELLKLPANTAVGARRLTEFIDGSSPRPGRDDLFFATAGDQSEIEKPWTYGDPPSRSSGSRRNGYAWDFSWIEWTILGALALICLGLLYLVYRVGRWIIRGFRG
ncbi:MAG: DUF2330 domain-containing protein [Burkholderiales bacterium]|nr:DUF2330 domain-containing protein [Burkholderiales bacterium]